MRWQQPHLNLINRISLKIISESRLNDKMFNDDDKPESKYFHKKFRTKRHK